MISRPTIPGVVMVLALALPGAAVATDAPPALDEPSAPTSETVAWLRGPFGAVVGGSPDAPATAAPDARALDAWMRKASLELATDPPLETLSSTVTAALIAGDGAAVVLAQDSRWLESPDVAGRYVVTAVLESDAAGRSAHAWLIDVPDREGSWDTLLEMPMLGATLRAGDMAVSSEPGHGCYVGMCQEVGRRPPAETLEPLTVSLGQPLELHLGDGSALIHWEGRLEPQDGTISETRLAEASFEVPVAGPVLTGLEPDVAGEWLLEVRADYDRERGWQWFLFRVVAE